MKKKCLFWSLTAATVMLLASCNNENIPEIENNGGKSATVKISIVSSSTRASSDTEPGIGNENKISKIEAYAFSASGAILDYISTDVTTATLEAEVGDVTIAVVANSNIGTVTTFDQLKAKLSTHEFTKTNSKKIPDDGFVMSAFKGVTLVEGANNEGLTVKRTVSKFAAPDFGSAVLDFSEVPMDRILEVFPTFDTETDNVEDIEFEYRAYALANGLDMSLLFNGAIYPETVWPALRDNWDTKFPSLGGFPFAYLNSTFEPGGSYGANGVYSGGFISDGTPVYVHENFPYPDFTPEGSSVTGYNPKEVYCFIIEGKLLLNEGGSPDTEATRYWRINLVKETTNPPDENDLDMYRIYRNGLYKVNVTKIKSAGYATPQEAEEETRIIPLDGETIITITVDVAPWDVYVSNTEM